MCDVDKRIMREVNVFEIFELFEQGGENIEGFILRW